MTRNTWEALGKGLALREPIWSQMFRSAAYDKSALLRDAARAEKRRRRSKAISLYRQVLAVEAGDAEVQARIAPLLARRRQRFDAWKAFDAAARNQLQAGKVDLALKLYEEATTLLPREAEAWLGLSRLQRREGRPHQALRTLLQGAKALRRRADRPRAIWLLRRAREIEAWDTQTVLELARLLGKTAQQPEARLLLRHLADRAQRADERAVRKAQLWLNPTPVAFWRWLVLAR